jgi:2-octaprenyl-6-methoxyphenol hydroxylase
MIQKFDIAIIGAGLTGKTASLALAKAGYKIALIDPNSFTNFKATEFDTRTTALSKKAKCFFDSIKIWKMLEPHTCMIKNILVNDGTSDQNIYFKKKEKKNYQPLGFMIKNQALSKILISNIKKNNKIIKYNNKVLNFVRDREKVILELDNKTNLQCDLLIGADGKNSIIRKKLGISTTIKKYNQKAFIFNVKHSKEHKNLATENFLEYGPLASLPIIHKKCNYYSSIVWSCNRPFYYKIIRYSKKEIENTLNFYLSNHYGKLKVISSIKSWDLSLVKANKYFDTRVILLGDSAHSIHPLAGQGFNLTLRGIENVYKIAILNKHNKNKLGDYKNLSLYNKKQYIDSLSIILMTDKLNYLFSNSNIFLKAFRKLGLRSFNKSSLLKNIFKNYASEGKFSIR